MLRVEGDDLLGNRSSMSHLIDAFIGIELRRTASRLMN